MKETWVWSLGWEDLLEEELATHFRILAWKIPWTEEPGGLQTTGLQRVRHNWVTEKAHINHKQGELESSMYESWVQLLSCVWLFATPLTAARQASLSITSSWSLLKLMSIDCHPTISSSVIPFSFRLQSFPASGSFPRSQFFASGGQIIGVSASASVFPVSIQDWFPLGLTGWISL